MNSNSTRPPFLRRNEAAGDDSPPTPRPRVRPAGRRVCEVCPGLVGRDIEQAHRLGSWRVVERLPAHAAHPQAEDFVAAQSAEQPHHGEGSNALHRISGAASEGEVRGLQVQARPPQPRPHESLRVFGRLFWLRYAAKAMCSRRRWHADSRLYPKRRDRGETRSRRLCMCVTRSAFVIKPNAVGIKHRRIGAQLCRKREIQATKLNSVDRVPAWLVAAAAARSLLNSFLPRLRHNPRLKVTGPLGTVQSCLALKCCPPAG